MKCCDGNNTNPIKSTPRKPVVVQEFDPNAKTLYASVHTTTTTTDTRSNNANTSTYSNICEECLLRITMILILENNETTRIEYLTANGSEKKSDGPIIRFS